MLFGRYIIVMFTKLLLTKRIFFSLQIYHVYYNTEDFSNKKDKKELIENGMVYTMDTTSPNADLVNAKPDVQV